MSVSSHLSAQQYGQPTQSDASTLAVLDDTSSTVASTTVSATVSTPTSTHTASSTSSTAHTTTSGSTHATTSSASSASLSSSQTSSADAAAFTYIQLDGDSLQPYSANYLDKAAFDQLCPTGDCYQACQNFGLLFDVESYVFDNSSTANITSSNGRVSLFGICTNIREITDTVTNNPTKLSHAASYFNNQAEQATANQIPANISMCLYDTCQHTRDPAQCKDLCWPDTLLLDTVGDMNFDEVSKCMRQLCSNVCGLPYANQDVFGIGVLWSYGIQAAVIIAYAAWLVLIWLVRKMIEPSNRVRTIADKLGFSSFLQSVSQSGTKRNRTANWLLSFSNKVNEAAVAFLAAECFFGVSVTVAAMHQGPTSIDPLNGYALLSVAITGFLPPIFTLMLLHSQKDQEWRPWFSTILVLLTWALSTVLFWLLYHNLSMMDGSNARLAEARNSLFNVTTCGGYSAMSLCQENMHNDPLRYMMEFYNWEKLPSMQTLWIPWVLATVVFFVVVIFRLIDHFSSPKGRAASTFRRRFTHTFWLISTGALTFAFIYQLLMYLRYREMKVIDTDNWTFGQIVALMVWVPVVLDIFFRPSLDRLQRIFRGEESTYTKLTTGTKDMRMSSSSPASLQPKSSYEPMRGQYQPAPASMPIGQSPILPSYHDPYSPYSGEVSHPTTPSSTV